jgi:hypothetical protein
LHAYAHLHSDRLQEFNEVLLMIESYLVRRMICGLTTKNYNRFFIELIKAVDKVEGSFVEAVSAYLLKGRSDTTRFPRDDEFLKALNYQPLYGRLSQPKVRAILEALDLRFHSSKSEYQSLPPGLTIEHVMPRAWEQHWGGSISAMQDPIAREKAAARRNLLINTLGNLTLLTDSLNPALSNSAWSTKHPELLKYSKSNLTRYFVESDFPVWDESAIEQRTKLLAQEVMAQWPAPAGAQLADLEIDDDGAIESDDSALSPRRAILVRFWSSLIERSQARTTAFANRRAGPVNWIGTAAGRPGFGFNLSLTSEFARVECYIGTSSRAENKAHFEELCAQQKAIEDDFGEALEWHPLNGKIGCRISKRFKGSWQLPETEWAPVQDVLIDGLIRMDRALRGRIRKLKVPAPEIA